MGNENDSSWQLIADRPYASLPGISESPELGWAAGHVAAGNMYVFGTNVVCSRTIFHHIRPYPAAGTVNTFEFFNVPTSRFVCSLPGAGSGLPTGMVFLLDGLSIGIETSLDETGTSVAGGAHGSVTSAAPATIAADLERAMNDGMVNLRVGEREVIKDVLGLKYFPVGAGLHGAMALSTTAATTSMSGAILNNGAPDVMNRGFPIDPLVPVLPGKTVRLTVEFQAARAISAGAGIRIVSRLHGTIITKGAAY